MTEKILLLYAAMCDKRTPWYAKALVVLLLAYIISPIDIIPDFIPIIGLLDEVILIPIALGVIFKMIPIEVVIEYEKGSDQININDENRKKLVITGVLFVASIWLALSFSLYYCFT